MEGSQESSGAEGQGSIGPMTDPGGQQSAPYQGKQVPGRRQDYRQDAGTENSPSVPPTALGDKEVAGLDAAQESALRQSLKQLLDKSPDIEAAAVVSMDGFVLAADLPDGYEEDRLGAMSAALLSLGDRTASELSRGELAQVFVEGTEGYVFLLAAGEDAVLNAIVKRGSKLGLILIDIRNAAKEIAAIIESHLQAEYE
jgi:predicted regulator of Ras-like GTPase activity (Roadblock/LC7/MglB family)